jgi:hypothetical protein
MDANDSVNDNGLVLAVSIRQGFTRDLYAMDGGHVSVLCGIHPQKTLSRIPALGSKFRPCARDARVEDAARAED